MFFSRFLFLNVVGRDDNLENVKISLFIIQGGVWGGVITHLDAVGIPLFVCITAYFFPNSV